MTENFSEFANVAGTNIQVFAMRFEDNKQVWSIGGDANGLGLRIGDTSENSIKSLKELRKAIDGAIKFMNDKPKEIDVAKGNTNDES